MNKGECEGCRFTTDYGYQGCLIYLARDKCGGCPCMACLVKPICSVLCNERTDFYNKIDAAHSNLIDRAFGYENKTMQIKHIKEKFNESKG